MHNLSNTLGELYDIADEAPVADAVNALFLSMRKLVPFNGAAMGDASGPQPFGLLPSGAHTFGLDAALLPAFARLAAQDPVAQAFHAGGLKTMSADCTQAYGSRTAQALSELAQANGIGVLLLSGTAKGVRNACWIVLVRGAGKVFSHADHAYLDAAWPHVARCLHSVHRRVLADLAREHGPGVALLYPDGAVAAADSQFAAMCHTEWNCSLHAMLPASASSAVVEHGEFIGRTLRLRLWREDGFIRCEATERTPCDLLTRAERVVAFRYASGESYKEIAVGLCVSENTVRTHLAHVYDKLGIHRKVELIHQIGHLH